MTKYHAMATAIGVLASTGALAHGGDDHATPRQFDLSKVERTAFGREGNPKEVKRTINVDMADSMRFTPAEIAVKRGETVKFVVHNSGKLLHEMVLGTKGVLAKHAELMKRFPEMEHADASMAHVKPSKTGEIVWQFTEPGEFHFACLQPGHFEAGMVGRVTVK